MKLSVNIVKPQFNIAIVALCIFQLMLCSFTYSDSSKEISVTMCDNHSGREQTLSINLSLFAGSDGCATATVLMDNVNDAGTTVGATSEVGEPTSPGIADIATANTVWYEITIPEGQPNVVFTFVGGGATTLMNPVVSIYANSCFGALVEEFDFNGTVAYPAAYSFCMDAGTYKIRVATDAADAGAYTINVNYQTIIQANDDCNSPGITDLVLGANSVDNTCAPDGMVWYEYTFVGGVDDDHLSVVANTPGFTIGNMFLFQAGACTTPVTATTCLQPGDVIHIEMGDASVPIAHNSFSVTVDEFDSPVIIDDCEDVVTNPILLCNNSITGAGNTAACPDNEATCAGNLNSPGVWYQFNVSNDVTTFDINGADFEVFTGTTCLGLTAFACAGDAALNNIDQDVNNDFFVLVYDSGSFTAIADPQTPANDLCANATPLINGTPINGSTACATPHNAVFCGLNTTDDHVVYYSYTTPNIQTSTNITFDYSGSGVSPATEVNIGVYSACNGTLLFSSCDNSPEDYLCVRPNTPLIIAVGSPDGSEGGFTLEATSDNTGIPGNDLCTNPDVIPFSSPADDCTWLNVAGNNTNACPETFAGSCNFNTNPTVWYEIVVPASSTALEFQNLTGGISIGVFNNNCAAPGYAPTAVGACVTGDQAVVTGGGTYLIAVTSVGAPFTFEVRAKVPPSNDLCANDIPLTLGTQLSGTTECATAPGDFVANCAAPGQIAVWYSYTVATPSKTLTLTVNNFSSGGTLSVAALQACGSGTIYNNDANNQECGGTISLDIDCPEVGTTIFFSVSSNVADEGTFDIVINQTAAALANDVCSTPTTIPYTPPTDDCEWLTVNGDNTNACPESFAGLCNFDDTPTVWYEITVPPASVGLEFQNLTGNISIGVFNDNCPLATSTPGQVGACVTGDQLVTTPGGTYLIAVTSNGAPFTFEIRSKLPPANDLCANDIPLTLNVTANGTTACATNTNDFFANCAAAGQNAVWYSYTVINDVKTLTLTINNFSSGGTISVAALAGCGAAALYNNDVNNQACGTSIDLDIDCPTAGSTIYFAVSSTVADEGTFDIEISETQAITVTNDDCATATTWNPIPLCELTDFGPYSNVNACPEIDDVGSCNFDSEETVWFGITLPLDANSIDIGMKNYSGTGNPVFALFTNCSGTSVDNVCHTAVSNGDPVANGDNIDVEAFAGTIVYLAFASQGDDGGSVEFDIIINNSPDNDDPCDAEVVSSGVTTGTTFCADMDFVDPNCPAADENQVWFQYTLGAGETGVDVTLTNTGTGGPFAVTLLEFETGCTNPPTILNTTSFNCDAEGETVKAVCLDPGTVVAILVSSAANDAGTFNIDVQPIVPTPTCIDNDACADAQDLGEVTTDANCNVVSDCNADACPELMTGCNGNIPVNNLVWYQVQNDGLGEFINVEITNAEFDEPIILVFKGPDCNNLTLLDGCTTGTGGAAGTGPVDIDPSGNPPVVGENYYVAIGSVDGDGGEFNLCIEILSGCVNDDACDAVELNPDAPPLANPASTIGCTQDYTNTDCPTSTANTVWYKFIVPEGVGSFSVRIVNNMITGPVSVQIGEYSTATCDALPTPDVSECATGSNITVEFPCALENQEYYIQIGSANGMDANTFEIYIRTDVPVVPNDLCSSAEAVDITEDDYCEYKEVTGTTLAACPEGFGGNNCPYNTENTVWYLVNIPDDDAITLANFEVEGITLTNPAFSVLEFDCDNPTAVSAATSCVNGATVATVEDVDIEPGTSYLIPVTSTTGDHGTFTLKIKVIAPPENDNCDDAIELDIPGSENGTTDCATNQPGVDFTGCTANLNEADVWYTIPIDPNMKGVRVTISGWTGTGNFGFEAYTSMGGCTLGIIPDMVDCSNATTKELEIPTGCLDPSITEIYIKVGSDSDVGLVGEFTISTEEMVPQCTYADNCAEAEPNGPLMTDPNFEQFFPICLPGCLDLACPEDPPFSACGVDQNPTVWFHFTTDAIAAQLFTSVEAAGTWDPVWSVYQGADCDNLTLIQGGPANSPACSNGDNTPTLHQTAVDGTIMDYWVAVTVDPNGPPVDDPNFTICAYTTINAIVCLGDITDNCNPDPSLELEVLARENGGSLDGPFCPGEEVTVKIKFFYDASETGADWLIGIVPSFGPGWDIEGFDWAGNAPGGSDYYDEDGDCAPFIDEGVPHLCTYVDDNGNLQLCNSICENCTSLCGQGGMLQGEPLPSGWFWVTNGGNAGCLNNCSPGEGWGIGSTTSNIDFDITLRVKEFDSMEECLQNKNLQISFQTFSDGVAGCWEDPVGECLIDRKQFGPIWEIECMVPPKVIATPDPFEICKMGITDITVNTEDGSTTPTIYVTYEDNPFVDGESDHVFPGGYGIVEDNLINNSDEIQIVTYSAYSEIEGLVCKGPKTEFTVILYPSLTIEFPPLYVCPGFCTVVGPPAVTGGSGIYVKYVWNTGAMTQTINVCPPVTTTYTVTVTDSKGCTGSKQVTVEVKPEVITEIVPDEISICQNSVPNDEDPIVIDFLSGSAPYIIDWVIPIGLEGQVQTTNEPNDTYILDEENSFFTFPGQPYMLCANIEDIYGCLDTVCVEIIISGRPEAILTTAEPVNCGDLTAILQAEFGFGGGLSGWDNHEVFDCNGEFVSGGGAATSTFGPVDLTECNVFYLHTTNQDGCIDIDTLEVPLTTGIAAIVKGDTICANGTNGMVSVTNAFAFTSLTWDTGQQGANIIVSPDSTTTYIVTATEANGCVSIKSAIVVVDEVPPLSISGSTSFCPNSSTQLQISSTSGNTYQWKLGNVVVSNADTVVINIAGAYLAIVTSPSGCVSDSLINVISSSSLQVNVNDVTLCDNMTDTMSAGAGFNGYVWTFTPTSGGTTSLPYTSFEIPVSAAGTYCVTVSDGGSCTGSTCKAVVNNTSPSINITDTISVCRTAGGSGPTVINFNSQVSGSTGTWENTDLIPGLDLSNLAAVDFVGVLRDTYTFTFLTNTAMAPCDDIMLPMEVIVVNCPCPTVNPIDTVCNSSTDPVDLNSYLANNPNNINGTWAWQAGPQNVVVTNGLANITDVNAGNYDFRWSPIASTCAPITARVPVIAPPTASTNPGPHFLCNKSGGQFPTTTNLNSYLTATTPLGGTWVQSGGTSVTINGTSIDVLDLAVGDITFEYTTQSAVEPCEDVTTSVTITVRDCSCPFVSINDWLVCNSQAPFNLNDSITIDPAGLAGTWSTTTPGVLTGSNFNPSTLLSGQFPISFTLTVDPGPTCQRKFDGNVVVVGQPIAKKLKDGTPCNTISGVGSTVVNLYDLLVSDYTPGGTWQQVTGPALTILPNGDVDFNGQAINANFSFRYTTNSALPPCTDVSVLVNAIVRNCDCPNTDILEPPTLCNSQDEFDLSTIQGPQLAPGAWTVKRGLINYPVNGKVLTTLGLPSGNYIATYTLNPVPTNPTCPKFVSDTIRIEEQNDAVLKASINICNDGSQTLNLNEQILSGYIFGTWENTQNAPIDFTNPGIIPITTSVPDGASYLFTYRIDNEDPCEDRTYTTTVNINCTPCIDNLPKTPSPHCTSEGVVNLSQYNDPARPGNWSSTTLTITNNTVDVTNVAAGNYTITYTPLDLEPNCPTVDQILTIIKPGNPGIAGPDEHVCFGVNELIDLAGMLTGEDANGKWREVSNVPSTGGAFNATNGTFRTNNASVSTYEFEYFYNNQSPCPETKTRVKVIIDDAVNASAGLSDTLTCTQSSASLGLLNGTSQGPNIKYEWTHNGGKLVPNADKATTQVDFTGVFTLKVVNTVTGCEAEDQVTISEDPDRPSSTFDTGNISCFGASDGFIKFTNVKGTKTPLQFSINGGTTFQSSPDFNNLGPGTYKAVMKDAIGCIFSTDFTLDQPTGLALNIGLDTLVLKGSTVTVDIASKIDPTRITNITWKITDEDGERTVCTQPTQSCLDYVHVYEKTSTVCVTISDDNNCSISDCKEIRVIKGRNIEFPNIINTNSTDGNGSFFVNSEDVKRINALRIFDRWGNLMYSVFDVDPKDPTARWDGKFNGKEVAQGVYTWTIDLTYADDNTLDSFAGDVTVIR